MNLLAANTPQQSIATLWLLTYTTHKQLSSWDTSTDLTYPLSQISSSCFLDKFFSCPSGVVPTSSSSSNTGALNKSLNIWFCLSCGLNTCRYWNPPNFQNHIVVSNNISLLVTLYYTKQSKPINNWVIEFFTILNLFYQKKSVEAWYSLLIRNAFSGEKYHTMSHCGQKFISTQ